SSPRVAGEREIRELRDAATHAIHELLDRRLGHLGHRDRLADVDADPPRNRGPGLARPDVARAADADRNDRHAGLAREVETALLEALDLGPGPARPLGEHEQRVPGAQVARGAVDGLDRAI